MKSPSSLYDVLAGLCLASCWIRSAHRPSRFQSFFSWNGLIYALYLLMFPFRALPHAIELISHLTYFVTDLAFDNVFIFSYLHAEGSNDVDNDRDMLLALASEREQQQTQTNATCLVMTVYMAKGVYRLQLAKRRYLHRFCRFKSQESRHSVRHGVGARVAAWSAAWRQSEWVSKNGQLGAGA
jgi:hypothetical protein